jgi:ankyrin repeat protein
MEGLHCIKLPPEETPLHRAVISKHEAVAKQLLQGGVDVNASDNGGWMPLHLAVSSVCDGMVALLLENGANPRPKNRKGYTALHGAVQVGNKTILEFLRDWTGIEPNISAADDATSLSLVVSKGREDIVQRLLEKGARDITPIPNQL